MEERLLDFYELLAREAGKLAKRPISPAPAPKKGPASERTVRAAVVEMRRERTA